MGQLSSRIENWVDRAKALPHNASKTEPFEIKDALSPNGIFPPEVAELILEYLCPDPKSLLSTSVSCKLWLQTASFYLKGFRRYKLDSSTPNPRAEIFRQQTIENNIRNGLYWPNLLAKQYMNARSGILTVDWSISKNLIAINKDKTVRMSMGPEHLFTRGTIVDLGRDCQETDVGWGVHLIGGAQVAPHRALWGWSWHYFTRYENREITISCKNQPPVSTEPYAALRIPDRKMTGLPNLDESPTVLIFDRPSKVNVDELTSFKIEAYNVRTGDLLYERTIANIGYDLIGYFKHYAICTSTKSTSFVDLNSGEITVKFPVRAMPDLFCICDRKIAFANGTSVLFYDWTTGQQISKLEIKGLFDQSKYKEHSREMKIQGIAFDRWKLVLGIGSVGATDQLGFEQFKEGDVAPAFIAIFELEGLKLLQRIHMPSTFRGSRVVKIALPPKGSIVVHNVALIEFDFNHPYLEKDFPVAFFNSKQEVMELQVSHVPPMQLSQFVQKKLNVDLSGVCALTYFARDPATVPKVRQARKFMLEESKRIPDWKSLRITFFFARPTTGPNPEDRNFTQLGQFAKYYEKLPDTTSTLILTSNEPAPNATASNSSQRLHCVSGNCVLLFEKYSPETRRWEIVAPFAPKGIDFKFDACDQKSYIASSY